MKRNIQSLGQMLRDKRGNQNLRDAANEIGIGHTTLARLEKGFQPDITTFNKICKWLGKNPNEILGYDNPQTEKSQTLTVSAHFRTNSPNEDTVKALALMILHASKMQPVTDK